MYICIITYYLLGIHNLKRCIYISQLASYIATYVANTQFTIKYMYNAVVVLEFSSYHFKPFKVSAYVPSTHKRNNYFMCLLCVDGRFLQTCSHIFNFKVVILIT